MRPARRARVLVAVGAVAVGLVVLAVVVAARVGDKAPVQPTGVLAQPAQSSDAAPQATASEEVGAQPPVEMRASASADAGARQIEARLAELAPSTVRYTFDGGPGRAMVDAAGHYALRQVAAAGGNISITRREGGYAVRFPRRCRLEPARCPRAILESTRADLFNAGTRPIRFGAAVLMTAADTGPGANVVQKGFSVGGGAQFKLQVDGRAGRPSCVLASAGAIYRLVAPFRVADGRWHNIVCARVGGRLSIAIDGAAVSRPIPAALSIRNSDPLRIGGKGAGPANDQFSGSIDEVFVATY